MLSSGCGDGNDRNVSSEEEVDVNNNFIDPQAEDQELKGQLLRRYSGYLGSLKQEFMKKRKKGKLPKEARQQLLDWCSRHYKWPYPSESQKLALAESTGLDQKQINNWFINQRKRHWKPSEDMQFVVMDAGHPHYYMDNAVHNPQRLLVKRGVPIKLPTKSHGNKALRFCSAILHSSHPPLQCFFSLKNDPLRLEDDRRLLIIGLISTFKSYDCRFREGFCVLLDPSLGLVAVVILLVSPVSFRASHAFCLNFVSFSRLGRCGDSSSLTSQSFRASNESSSFIKGRGSSLAYGRFQRLTELLNLLMDCFLLIYYLQRMWTFSGPGNSSDKFS
ncbi:hypothetical protein NC651_026138 [Populus alba x Populus x berolinensis]|nr:hypothetical protein NC651_026138 [Populus alba x Populus x berolinensis]